MSSPQESRPVLVTIAAAVFVCNVVVSLPLFALSVTESASPLPQTLGALGVVAALMAFELWVARSVLRGTRRGWFVGTAFAVFMLLPIGWDDLPLPNAIYAAVSFAAFAVVLVALWLERKWFERASLESVGDPV